MTAAALAPLRLLPTVYGPSLTLDEAIARGREDREVGTGYVQGALAFEVCDPEREEGPELPDPLPHAHSLAQAIVEVMAGTRPSAQLVRWTTPVVHDVVARQGALALRRIATSPPGTPRPRQRLAVRRVLLCRPAPRVAEATVVLTDGPRVRAMALRLVCPDGRWRVEALQIG